MKRTVKLILIVLSFCGCTNDKSANPSELLAPDIILVKFKRELPKYANVTADIDFDSVLSTKSLYYGIRNNGDKDAFNLKFVSDKLITTPNKISLLPVTQSSDINLLPVIEFTLEHGIPKTGIGNFVPLESGEIVDSFLISYQYFGVDNDTLIATKSFSFTALKVAAIADVFVNGNSVLNLPDFEIRSPYNSAIIDNFVQILNFADTLYMRDLYLHNLGNTALDISLIEWQVSPDPFVKFILESGDSLDLFSYMRIDIDSTTVDTVSGDTTVPTTVQFATVWFPDIKIGPTPYLISASDVVFSSGFCYINMYMEIRKLIFGLP